MVGPKKQDFWPRINNHHTQRRMEIGCEVLLGHFEPVYLLQVDKNDDEEQSFLE